jgi:hypothetical protein
MGVSLCGLAIYIKKYLKAKEKNYGNSKIISPCKIIIFKKKKPKKTKILQDIITLQLISCLNTSQNISSFQNPHIKIDLLYYYYLVWAKIP